MDFARLHAPTATASTSTSTSPAPRATSSKDARTLAARDRLGGEGLDVRFHPGGHLTTHEHPDLLADIINELINRPTI